MGADTGIEWADHTFNPWTGCQKVSPACDHCYAEATAKRAPSTFGGWGPGAERKRTSESYWRQPLLWNKRAAKDGMRPRVFCASMADVFDNAVPLDWFIDLLQLIHDTPNLDWLLLTKRPQNIRKLLGSAASTAEMHGGEYLARWVDAWRAASPPPHVWLGTTVENQAEADRRIPHLLAVPAAKRFLSMEPLLGQVDLTRARHPSGGWDNFLTGDTHRGQAIWSQSTGLDWIIAGGESGLKARPSHPDWFRSLRDQCASAGVPFFFKQTGEWDVASKDNGYRWGSSMSDGPAVWVGQDGRTQKPSHHGLENPVAIWKRGKKVAGAMLDGREWREVPA
jgi:protein gp37